MAEGFPSLNVATGLLHRQTIIPTPSQLCLVKMLLYSTIDASHVRLAWCCYIAPAQLIQMDMARNRGTFPVQ